MERNLEHFFDVTVESAVLDLLYLRHKAQGCCGCPGCAAATAMFAFSICNLLGELMPEKKQGGDGKKIEWALKNRDIFADEVYTESAEFLVYVVRHGLAHEILPKCCGLSKGGEHTEELLFKLKDGDVITLNVDRFVEDLVSGLFGLRDHVEMDGELADRMAERLARTQKKQAGNYKKYSEELAVPVLNLDFPVTTTTTTT